MANVKDRITLPYSLVPNTLPEVGGYHRVLTHVGSADDDELFKDVADKVPGQTVAGVRATYESLIATVMYYLTRFQYRVSVNGVLFTLAIPGSTESVNGTPEEGIYVAITLPDAIKYVAAAITPTYSSGETDVPEVTSVEDLSSRERGKVKVNGAFCTVGNNISASGADESIVVTAADGTEALAEVTGEDGYGAFITARFTKALPPGKGKVTLMTHGKRTPEGELRPCVKNVTIVDATPPTPTGDEPVVTSGHSSGYSDPGMIDPNADFIMGGHNLAGASVRVDWTDEGGNERTQNIPAGETTAEDEEITLQQGDWLEACTTVDGAVLTFTVTTSHGSTTYQATVRA